MQTYTPSQAEFNSPAILLGDYALWTFKHVTTTKWIMNCQAETAIYFYKFLVKAGKLTGLETEPNRKTVKPRVHTTPKTNCPLSKTVNMFLSEKISHSVSRV